MPRRFGISRRRLLEAGVVGTVAVATGGLADLVLSRPAAPIRVALASPAQRRGFRSRPDLTPPLVSVASRADVEPGNSLVLLTPSNGAPDGPTILTLAGEPVWVHPISGGRQAANLRIATYRGEPVLTWWEGTISPIGYGAGEYVIVDSSYREITRFHAGDGYPSDLHEFVIGPNDTAFVLTTRVVPGTVPAPSGPIAGPILEGVVREIDIATSRVVFEWHSLPAIDPTESYAPTPTDASPFDYLHANSIDIDGDGIVVSARHTWGVYRINRGSGTIDWRLNGRRSDYAMGTGASFAWQHDARMQPDGTISIFDDGSNGLGTPAEASSRGIVLALDHEQRSARLLRAFAHPDGVSSTSQGSFQVLPDGGGFVGWGSLPRYTRFDGAGAVILDASFAAGIMSYRSFLRPWTGRPSQPPDVVVEGSSAPRNVYVSWNGATGVARWEILDPASGDAAPVVSSAATGFETALAVPDTLARVIVRATDATGAELGRREVSLEG